MAKNNKLINQYKAMYQKIQQITPEIYASMALALHRKYNWDFDKINELFTESQVIWDECVQKDINMVEMCYQETGIELQNK